MLELKVFVKGEHKYRYQVLCPKNSNCEKEIKEDLKYCDVCKYFIRYEFRGENDEVAIPFGENFVIFCNYDSLKGRIIKIMEKFIIQKCSYLFTVELIMKEIDNYNKENSKDKKDEDENEGETIIIHKT